jgi:hypothetical protein
VKSWVRQHPLRVSEVVEVGMLEVEMEGECHRMLERW